MSETLQHSDSLHSIAERHMQGAVALTIQQEQNPAMLAAIDAIEQAKQRNAALYGRIDARNSESSALQEHLRRLPERLGALGLNQ